MHTHPLRVALAVAAAVTGMTVATTSPALAQGDPLYGEGNVYLLSGAYNADGLAQQVIRYARPLDEIYFGDWWGDGIDQPMVRYGNQFYVTSPGLPERNGPIFNYGNDDDELYIGDWDGDGKDSIAVRRGNSYFIKNDILSSSVADTVIQYGNDDDEVLVGNWNGELVGPKSPGGGKGDTLMVRRGGQYFVKNDLRSGVADAVFLFGNPDDEVLVGDWVDITTSAGEVVVSSGDGADQLAVRRGNEYFVSAEVRSGTGLVTTREYAYGDPDDAVFVASWPTPLDADGQLTDDPDLVATVIEGDGLGVRRFG